LTDVPDCSELTDGQLFGFTTDNAASKYTMTCELQSTLEIAGIEWPVLRNHIPCMVQVINPALGAFMCSFGVKGRTKSWESPERDHQFGENESMNIGNSQRLRNEDNARINKVSDMKPGFANIIEKVRTSVKAYARVWICMKVYR
jgi:hypothetical protein